MGRHYTGDIEGRFAFAIQSSDDANFFGVTGTQPELLAYYFEKEDLPKVKKGVKKCEAYLVDFKPKLKKFFKGKEYYNRDSTMGCTIAFRKENQRVH